MKLSKDLFKGILMGIIFTLCFSSIAVMAATPTVKKLEAVFKDIKLKVNGKEVQMRDSKGYIVEPFIVDGTTYLPVRSVAEALGQKVGWDGKTSTVIIGEEPMKEYIGIGDLKPTNKKLDDKDCTLQLDEAWENGKISMNGKEYSATDSILTDCGSVIYNIDSDYSKLTGLIGIDDSEEEGAKSRVSIWADNELVFKEIVVHGDEPLKLNLDLHEVNQLEIAAKGLMGTTYAPRKTNFVDMMLYKADY